MLRRRAHLYPRRLYTQPVAVAMARPPLDSLLSQWFLVSWVYSRLRFHHDGSGSLALGKSVVVLARRSHLGSLLIQTWLPFLAPLRRRRLVASYPSSRAAFAAMGYHSSWLN